MLSSKRFGSFCTSIVFTLVGIGLLPERVFALEWGEWRRGNDVGNLVRGGTDSFGYRDGLEGDGYVENDYYYVCRAYTDNGLQAGHIGEGRNICYVAWGRGYEEYGLGEYEVLRADYNEVFWISRNDANDFDPGYLVRLHPENGRDTLICRGPDGLPGKVIGGVNVGVCYTSWGDRNRPWTDDFDVLVCRRTSQCEDIDPNPN